MRFPARPQTWGMALLMAALALAACESPTPPTAATPEPIVSEAEVDAPTRGVEDLASSLSAGELSGSLSMQSAALDAAGAQARILDLLGEVQTGGTVGAYLREIGGPTVLSHNENFVFEPASAIKALTHFHAMRQVQDGAVIGGAVVTLDREIPWFRGPTNYSNDPGPGETSCPDLSTLPREDRLAFILRTMMVNSDNRTTDAARDFFGPGAIDGTRVALGMASSRHVHLIGCGPDIVANPNWLTLADAGRLYEAAATTYLDEATRWEAFNLMPRGLNRFNEIITEEHNALRAGTLGLQAPSLNSFRNLRDAAFKGGSYGVDVDGERKQYRSVAGWSTIPFRNTTTCAVEPREYVWGVFVHEADGYSQTIGIGTVGAETLREPIRAALQTWMDCEADLFMSNVRVLGLDDPLFVNQPASFTVRADVSNSGPASPVDVLVTLTASAPDDCTFDASPKTAVVPVPLGVGVPVDFPFEVVCTAPSDHRFSFNARIEPADERIRDPVSMNNSFSQSVDRELIAYADLGVEAWDLSALEEAFASDLVVGETFSFTATRTFRNRGDTELGLYFDPAEALISRTLMVPAGIEASITVTEDEASASVVIERDGQPDEVMEGIPAGTTVSVEGAAVVTVTSRRFIDAEGILEIPGSWALACLAPGDFDLVFRAGIEAVDPHLLDPDPSDNTLVETRSVDCAVPVQLNIRPGNRQNWINPGSSEVVPSAVLTTEAGEYGLPLAFDAAGIDPLSVRFGVPAVLSAGGGGTVHQDFLRDSFEMDDFTRDGDLDKVLHFRVTGAGVTGATTTLYVVGRFQDETGGWYTFVGSDTIQVQGN